MPTPPVLRFATRVREMVRLAGAFGSKRMPPKVNWLIEQSSTDSDPPLVKTIPLLAVLAPTMVSPRKTILSLGPAVIVIALPLVAVAPAVLVWLTMLTAWLIVTAPYPAVSST